MGQAVREPRIALRPRSSESGEWALVTCSMDEGGIPRARLRQLLIDLSIMVGIGLLLAFLGPLGTFEQSFARRLIYWVSLSLTGYACYVPTIQAILRAGRSLELPDLALWVAAVFVATVPMTAVVIVAGQLPGPFSLPRFEDTVATYGYVLVVGGFVSLLFQLIENYTARKPRAAPQPDRSAASRPGLLDQLPPDLGSELIALEMEDHYVRVHTALGSGLVLRRMRDAIAELGDIEGMQVHRSWWVARHAVAGVHRDGRNLRLRLDNGLEAPVSRANVSALKKAGWI